MLQIFEILPAQCHRIIDILHRILPVLWEGYDGLKPLVFFLQSMLEPGKPEDITTSNVALLLEDDPGLAGKHIHHL